MTCRRRRKNAPRHSAGCLSLRLRTRECHDRTLGVSSYVRITPTSEARISLTSPPLVVLSATKGLKLFCTQRYFTTLNMTFTPKDSSLRSEWQDFKPSALSRADNIADKNHSTDYEIGVFSWNSLEQSDFQNFRRKFQISFWLCLFFLFARNKKIAQDDTSFWARRGEESHLTFAAIMLLFTYFIYNCKKMYTI